MDDKANLDLHIWEYLSNYRPHLQYGNWSPNFKYGNHWWGCLNLNLLPQLSPMIIQNPEVKKYFNDYDVTFESGMMVPLSLDLDLGDTIEFGDKAILVHLSAKPSQHDPDRLLPAEDMTIFLSHVLLVQHRVREVVELSPDQKAQFHKTWQEMNLVTDRVQ